MSQSFTTQEQPCIRCGECTAACPAGLYPALLLAAVRRDDLSAASALGLEACLQCGRCDAYCPSAIPLSQYFAQAYAPIAQAKAAREFARQSRERFQRREIRLQREKEEQAAERQRQRANNASAQAVAAALARAGLKRKSPPSP